MEFEKECKKIRQYQEADVWLEKIIQEIRNGKKSVGDLYKIYSVCLFQRNIICSEVWKVCIMEKFVETNRLGLSILIWAHRTIKML